MLSRRIVLGLMSLGAVATAVGMWAASALRAVAGRPRARQEVVVFSRLPQPGQAVVKGRVGLCRDEGGYFALLLACPHLGCTPRLERHYWSCPCHGSRFSFGGKRIHGPAPRGLTHLRVQRTSQGLVIELTRQVPESWRLKA